MNNTNVPSKNSTMNAFDSIKAGLEQAIEFQRNALAGKPNAAKVHRKSAFAELIRLKAPYTA
jgi:hypothetical protein